MRRFLFFDSQRRGRRCISSGYKTLLEYIITFPRALLAFRGAFVYNSFVTVSLFIRRNVKEKRKMKKDRCEDEEIGFTL